MSLAGGLIAGLGGYASGFFNYRANQQNINYQKEVQEYQKELQEQIFEREDNAMQRKVADYKKAGFNPILAAGGSGSLAGTPIPINPKKKEMLPAGASNLAQLAMALIKQRKDIARTEAQNKLTRFQSGKAFWDRKNAKLNYERNKRDFGIEEKSGTHSKPSSLGKFTRDGQGIATKLIENTMKSNWHKNNVKDYQKMIDDLPDNVRKEYFEYYENQK